MTNSSKTDELDRPPAPDEIEISVLGRGYGECTVIHLGAGEWAVIDSLVTSDGRSAPLDYLTKIGVDPRQVRLILATHWHDDHVAGMSALYGAASYAELVLPLPMSLVEFRTYVSSAAGGAVGAVTSGVAELAKLIAIRNAEGRPPPTLAQASMTLLNKTITLPEGIVDVSLTALSPHPRDIDAFLQRIGTAFQPMAIARRLMAFSPNDASVATWLRFGADAALFGADLENPSETDRGWRAVMSSTKWPRGIASVFKVAHHGSENAHNDSVWADLLLTPVIAAIAPWNRGRGLPKQSDVQRIRALTENAFTTTQSPFRKFRNDKRISSSGLDNAGIKINSMPLQVGIVRLRRAIARHSEWRVGLYDGATPLSSFVARA